MRIRTGESKADFESSQIYQELLQYSQTYPSISGNGLFTETMLTNAANYYQGLSKRDISLEEALKNFKNDLNDHPYHLVLLPKVNFFNVDYFLLKLLPASHSWHSHPADQMRCDGIIDAVFKAGRHDGKAVLTTKEFNQMVGEIADANLTPHERKLYQPQIKQGILKSTHYRKTAYQDATSLSDEYLEGFINTNYQQKLATGVKDLLARVTNPLTPVNMAKLGSVLSYLQVSDGFSLSDEQQHVVTKMIENPVSVVLGSAGTGKSTMVKALTNYLTKVGIIPKQVAYSGKAAFNLQAMTKLPASTILAALAHQPLDLRKAQYVIIDEISTMPEMTLANFLSYVNPNAHVILIGDHAQFPAVNDIGFMTTLLQYLKGPYNKLPYYQLMHVFRQDQASNLLDSATAIRKGQLRSYHVYDGDKSLDYTQVHGMAEVEDAYLALINAHPDESVMLLTPRRNGDEGTIQLNEYLQKVHAQTVSEPPLTIGKHQKFYVGDKVLITQNMYDVEICDVNGKPLNEKGDVLNGFVGEVTKLFTGIGRQRAVLVKLPHCGMHDTDLYVKFYPWANVLKMHGKVASLDNLDLGYALTVHKAQGSTIDQVIYYVPKSAYFMLNRQALYTAFTRAKSLHVMTNFNLSDNWLDSCVKMDIYRELTSNLSYLMNVYSASHLQQVPTVTTQNQF